MARQSPLDDNFSPWINVQGGHAVHFGSRPLRWVSMALCSRLVLRRQLCDTAMHYPNGWVHLFPTNLEAEWGISKSTPTSYPSAIWELYGSSGTDAAAALSTFACVALHWTNPRVQPSPHTLCSQGGAPWMLGRSVLAEGLAPSRSAVANWM